MSREIRLYNEGRIPMLEGMNKVIKAVAPTLGPKGRNAVLDKTSLGGTCIVTNDGVSIARDIVLDDSYENQGAQLLIQVANTTNEIAGDGTTTSMVLAYAMVEIGMKNLVAGANPIILRQGMRKAVDKVLEFLEEQAVPVTTPEEIGKIATISSGDSVIGELLEKAAREISLTGFITLEDGKTQETSLKIIHGMRLISGYLSRYMCNKKEEKRVEYANPYILITDSKLESIQVIVPILEEVTKEKRPLLIIAPEFGDEVLNTIVLNDVKGIFQIAAIKAPGFGEMQKDVLGDLAVLTKGTFFQEVRGDNIEKATLDMLGRAGKIIVEEKQTIIMEGAGEKKDIENRVLEIKKQQAEETTEFNRERFRERISKITNGMGVIQIGAFSEIEMLEKKLRIEDAISATQAGVALGMVIGGGCALVHSTKALNKLIAELEGDEKVGAQIVAYALLEPTKQIAINGGLEGEVIIQKILELGNEEGFDPVLEEYGNLREKGIVDPLKVVKTALINAQSVASTMLTAEAVQVIIKGTEDEYAQFAGN